MVFLLEGSPISREEPWSSFRVTIEFLVTSLTKALHPWLLSLAGRPALERVLVVPSFFHLRMEEATMFLGTFNAVKMFWYPSPDLCLDTILSRSSKNNSFDPMAWFLLWHALSTVGPYIDRCVPFQVMSNQLNLPQVDSKQDISRMINGNSSISSLIAKGLGIFILLGSPLAVAKAATTLPEVHTKHDIIHQINRQELHQFKKCIKRHVAYISIHTQTI